jgi:hypothetical protein
MFVYMYMYMYMFVYMFVYKLKLIGEYIFCLFILFLCIIH